MAASGGHWKNGNFKAAGGGGKAGSATGLSKGSEGIIGNYEYFRDEKGDLYKASVTYPINQAGYRSGADFEAPRHLADYFLQQARAPRQLTMFD